MGLSRSVAAVVVIIALFAIAKNVSVTTTPTSGPDKQSTRATAASPTDGAAEVVPPMPNNPHAFTIVPKNYNDPPQQLLAAARSLIAR
jgi:hypothetical protein